MELSNGLKMAVKQAREIIRHTASEAIRTGLGELTGLANGVFIQHITLKNLDNWDGVKDADGDEISPGYYLTTNGQDPIHLIFDEHNKWGLGLVTRICWVTWNVLSITNEIIPTEFKNPFSWEYNRQWQAREVC